MGIYKRKQESKNTRKQEIDQESDQENQEKTFLVDFLFSCILVFFYEFPPLIDLTADFGVKTNAKLTPIF